VSIKQTNFLWFLLMFHHCVQILKWSFRQLLNNKIYTSPLSFIEIYLKMTYLCRFNHDNPQFSFSAFGALSSPVVCWWLWKKPVCLWCGWRQWRWTERLHMLEVTIIGRHSHIGSKAFGEVRHRLVDVFLWQLFPGNRVRPLPRWGVLIMCRTK